ncbi:hypothetical protein [Fontibacillus phaseoli]|uniref:hypothetical protein n=1 Tax=Fontibacillus phaseoli TaxID=1416533 RepID=UPI000DF48CDE|nr:hypothetical protein [Fontibacillus phaseoli]
MPKTCGNDHEISTFWVAILMIGLVFGEIADFYDLISKLIAFGKGILVKAAGIAPFITAILRKIIWLGQIAPKWSLLVTIGYESALRRHGSPPFPAEPCLSFAGSGL